MKTNRKLAMPSLVLLALLFGSFSHLVGHVQAQSNTADEQKCILIGAETELTDDENAGDVGENEAVDDANEDEAGDIDAQDAEGTDDAESETDATELDDAEATTTYTGTIAVDEAAFVGMTDTDYCSALTTLATVTAEAAQTTAAAEGTPTMVEIEVENGYLVYGVALDDGRDVKIDAGSGVILNIDAADDTESGADQMDSSDAVAPATTGITADEAQAIAETETGSTTLAVEFDVENGVQIFEVEMADGTDVQVNANDGTIILIEQRDAQ